MDALNALLEKQYRQYRQRMNYLAWYFRWDLKHYLPLIPSPVVKHHGQIR